MKPSSSRSRFLTILSVAALAGAAACDSPVEPDDHADDLEVQLLDRDTGVLLAETHDREFEEAMPNLLVGEEIAVNALFIAADGDTIELGGEFTVEAGLADGAPDGIVAIANHGDHIDIEALAAGQTQLIIELRHGEHADWTSGSITVVVEEP